MLSEMREPDVDSGINSAKACVLCSVFLTYKKSSRASDQSRRVHSHGGAYTPQQEAKALEEHR